MSYRDDFKEVQSEAWWSLPRIALAVLVFGIFIYAAGFLMTGGDLAIYKFWAPKQANAENEVFHNTQAFTDGKNVHIGDLCIESAKADGNVKAAFDSEIRTEASTVAFDKLSADNQACVLRAKGM
jgi:hypothetical protein